MNKKVLRTKRATCSQWASSSLQLNHGLEGVNESLDLGGGRGDLKELLCANVSTIQFRAFEQYSISFSKDLSLRSKSLVSVKCLTTVSTLTDILLRRSESLLLFLLFCVVRKSSFCTVSHVISRLAGFPFNSNTKW